MTKVRIALAFAALAALLALGHFLFPYSFKEAAWTIGTYVITL